MERVKNIPIFYFSLLETNFETEKQVFRKVILSGFLLFSFHIIIHLFNYYRNKNLVILLFITRRRHTLGIIVLIKLTNKQILKFLKILKYCTAIENTKRQKFSKLLQNSYINVSFGNNPRAILWRFSYFLTAGRWRGQHLSWQNLS